MPELALFLSAFAAATILPFSSEAAVVTAILNDMPKQSVLFYASLGNVLAVIFNYYIGYFLSIKSSKKLHSSKVGKKALACGNKYGYFALLFSWLPIIGDPLTIVAGVVRVKFVWFVLIVGSLRILRYYLIVQYLN